ncbi:biotin carboxyl carrier protein of acetyl-CoA carboxylase, chloroplastic-like isoform X1 [Telopea speciosissima]|uniref:biotin carboxyl carrier protein of acetyl-CoA carboxylase, chloroplastic-like isoform X1 n=1 Tax=Telopea speciosissima TaxID=54955 RepID=UPI001CC59BA6|nr:biotin carboxyl carrier protein of acetyl-CoA carboxylase, chloroplastic-like isoform X1 [Telopea speciosissima]XP_043704289.1 biotin carboxyl carrier protein of acetyl-CoA carboxylase, chloroplastic-like isoform X2 [Telopea speciosissima]XP_043704290.1 biotin carboxyl carrier protein of acetyl-CoA carboxylase, chloroplastic-like isoform X1 [Telopea speciosissima]XP_043704291.1 biotin carboxyl carrier protein of acetyl-CoA carboxylase, chloroplastic-like isoform X1 [Telopea speciosissima]XP_
MASFSVSCPNSSAFSVCGSQPQNPKQSKVSFLPASTLTPPSSSLLAGSSALLRLQGPLRSRSAVCKVAIEKSSNSAPVLETKLEVPSLQPKDEPGEPAPQNTVPDASSISAFMAQVSDLVKLVDSRDIMELHLKQQDCELIIRKKEALPQPPAAPPVFMMQPPSPQAMPSQLPAPQSSAPSSPAPAAPALPAPAKKSKSSHPPMKCPMAGTFYRSPAPGEPVFVKVGDKVKKGEVVCIIEAMKLMNEVEADQSGTIVDIMVENGKPVSLDMPLFVIEP